MAERPVLLVTGASSGIGEESARQAAASGYDVVLAARRKERLDGLVDELGSNRAMAVRCDVNEWGDQQAAVAAALEHFGRFDAVFANAGFGVRRGFTTGTPELWRQMVLTNVYGAALTVRASIDALRESQGHLLFCGSVAGHVAVVGSLYSATKFAVGAMAEAARKELNGTGCRVTLISPGTVETPFYDNPVGGEQLTAEDVARMVVFALTQPRHVDVNEIFVRPTTQDL
jgi:NADP-dependent 3-hydroxy acid dehydrogenase YdfG